MSKLVVTLGSMGLLDGLRLSKSEVVVKTGHSRVLTSAGKWYTLPYVRGCMETQVSELRMARGTDTRLDHMVVRNTQILTNALSAIMAKKHNTSLIGFPAVQYLLGSALYLMRAGHHGMIAGAWVWKPGPYLEGYLLKQSMSAALVSCLDAELHYETVGESDLSRISGCIESEEGRKWRAHRASEMRAELKDFPAFQPDDQTSRSDVYWYLPAAKNITIQLDSIRLQWSVRSGKTSAVLFEDTHAMVAFVTGLPKEVQDDSNSPTTT